MEGILKLFFINGKLVPYIVCGLEDEGAVGGLALVDGALPCRDLPFVLQVVVFKMADRYPSIEF